MKVYEIDTGDLSRFIPNGTTIIKMVTLQEATNAINNVWNKVEELESHGYNSSDEEWHDIKRKYIEGDFQ